MRDMNHRGTQLPMQSPQFGTHLATQLGIQIRQRFIQQEDARIANDRTAKGHTLSLSTREFAWMTTQEILETEHIGRSSDSIVDVLLLGSPVLPVHTGEDRTQAAGVSAPAQEAEGEVLLDVHVWIQGIVLEDHRDVAILGRQRVHLPVVDVDITRRDRFKPRDHPQRGALAATRWTDQDDELTIGDLQTDVVHGVDITGIDLGNGTESYVCHDYPLTAPDPIPSTKARCAAKNSTTQGIIVTTLTAMSRCTFSSPPYWFRKEFRARASVDWSSE